MPYGSLALDAISTSGNLSVTGNVSTSGNLSVTGNVTTSGTILNSSGRPMLNQTGAVLQVVQTTMTGTFSTTSTTFTDLTGMSASITPSSTSSRILVIAYLTGSQSGYNAVRVNLVRGSTNIFQPASGLGSTYSGTVTASNTVSPLTIAFVDSPSTSSLVTYKLQCATNAGTLYFGIRGDGAVTWPGSLILMEIAG
jgi:hypothetical protein